MTTSTPRNMSYGTSNNLVEQVAAALGPDGVWEELHPFIPSLQRPRNGSAEVRALCPGHNDHRPSWCWNLERGLACCHVCGEGNMSFIRLIAQRTGRRPVMVLDEYCRRLKLPRPRGRTLTVEDYAAAKCLPVSFLIDRFQVSDGRDGLRLPYLDGDGRVLEERVRKSMSAKLRWSRQGVVAKRMVYGRYGIRWIGATGYVLVVEGESDAHSL